MDSYTDTPKRILITEDEKPLLHALVLKLEHEGYVVDTARDGNECLELLQKETYDVLLLDMIMPNMDGYEVLEFIQEHTIATRILVLSNLSQDEDVQRALKLGADKFYVKANVSLATIVNDIRNL